MEQTKCNTSIKALMPWYIQMWWWPSTNQFILIDGIMAFDKPIYTYRWDNGLWQTHLYI